MSAVIGRREFVAAFGAAVAWPTAASAQVAVAATAGPYAPFPYDGNTGITSPLSSLTPSAGFDASTAGATYTGLKFTGSGINVKANNVTI